jgi:hypothetical protein
VGVERFVARALPAMTLVGAFFGAPAVAGVTGDAVSTTASHGAAHRSAPVVAPLHPEPVVRLLAARMYWGSGHPSYPTSAAEKRDLGRTASYFERISRGRQAFHWELTPWVHVAVGRQVMCGAQAGSRRATVAALRRAGYRMGRYNRLMILTEQCHNAYSIGQQPGADSWIRYPDPGMATMVHELGHNLGLGHAYGLICTQQGIRVALGRHCRPVEYGDSWDAMGHSNASYSVPVLQRLGWAGHVVTLDASAGTDGSYRIANLEHPGSRTQGLQIRVSPTLSYWVEYQPTRGPVVGRSIPGVMIRRDVAGAPGVELIDASPGNPSDLSYPDRDLENPALPVGSSLTTPEDIRITTQGTGRTALVRVTFDRAASVPGAPVVADAARLQSGGYLVRWRPPADHGQVVLGYRVTAQPSGVSRYVRGPGAYRTSLTMPAVAGGDSPRFTVQARNQVGWSPLSGPVSATARGGQRPVERQGRSRSDAT